MSVDNDEKMKSVHQRWAEFRFGVVGGLLAAPPERGELSQVLQDLAEKQWKHPTTGQPTRFGQSTIERWYSLALSNERKSPVDILRRKVRNDAGSYPGMSEYVRELIRAQHERYPYWSYQLHYDNLKVVLEKTPEQKRPAYNTMKRFMQGLGLMKRKRPRRRDDGSITAGEARGSKL
jgi:hypothetical protein